jgi:hypothetical protein
MSPLNITQPLGIWSMPWLLFSVMSNLPKMGHLPTHGFHRVILGQGGVPQLLDVLLIPLTICL